MDNLREQHSKLVIFVSNDEVNWSLVPISELPEWVLERDVINELIAGNVASRIGSNECYAGALMGDIGTVYH